MNLTSKISLRLISLIAISFMFAFETRAQDTSLGKDSLRLSDEEYFIVLAHNKKISKSDTLQKGDKAIIKLTQKEEGVPYTIQSITESQLIVSNKKGERKIIHADQIIQIRKKRSSANTTIGTVLIIGGTAVMGPVVAGSSDFDAIVPMFLLGAGLVTGGIAMVTPPSYKLQKNATIKFYKMNKKEITSN